MSARPSILITRPWPDPALARLRDRYDLHIVPADQPLDRSGLIEAMRQYDAIGPSVTERIDSAILEAPGRRVQILANFGVGYEHIDTSAARANGVIVTNTPGVLTDATADLALLLMLMVSRRAGEGERMVRAGKWGGWQPTQLMGGDLAGKLLGIIGFGRIGQATARRACALGMAIAYTGRRQLTHEEIGFDAEFIPEIEQLLARADVVSLHCPGGAETRHLIDAARLEQMKPSAILINTARGSVVDEVALAAACASGRIGGAGLDVYEREPHVTEALLPLENVVLLPHLGSATLETRLAMAMRAADNLDAFFDGKDPPDRVA